MANLNKIVYLTNEEYATLVSQGTVTLASGTVVTYNQNDMYIVPAEEVSNATITLKFDDNTISFNLNQANNQTIVLNDLGITCFRGDTSYITMANGETKLIKDVKNGDIVLSYDVEKQQPCEAIVLNCKNTGNEYEYDTYFFDNGTTLEIVGYEHFVCDFDQEQRAISGFVGLAERMIESLKQDLASGKNWYSVLTQNGSAKLINVGKYYPKQPTAHYTLETSNGSYYVNGLLHTNRVCDVPMFWSKLDLHNEQIDAIIEQMQSIYSVRDESLPNDNVGSEECKELLNAYKQAEQIIASNKAYLTSTDYKAIKYAEGIIDEDEWNDVKEKRADARAIINEQEVIAKDTRAILFEKYPNVLPLNWKEVQYIWRRVMSVANDNYPILKEILLPKENEDAL